MIFSNAYWLYVCFFLLYFILRSVAAYRTVLSCYHGNALCDCLNKPLSIIIYYSIYMIWLCLTLNACLSRVGHNTAEALAHIHLLTEFSTGFEMCPVIGRSLTNHQSSKTGGRVTVFSSKQWHVVKAVEVLLLVAAWVYEWMSLVNRFTMTKQSDLSVIHWLTHQSVARWPRLD